MHSSEAVPFVPAAAAGELQLRLEKLGVLGRVLYLAAHPDDENTRLITAWARGDLYDTGYLSLTRGSGGQNLIGPELGDALGVIRTQELLAARSLDGGQQFFTRAKDFGYSKNAAETFANWDRESVLGDVVWVIRNFRPDVIVTRFNLEDGFTHGHHTASARLAVEAFEAAADPDRFPDQLDQVETWQATRVLWNTSEWFFRRQNVEFDPDAWLAEEAGDYLPLLGQSIGELSARSRSMHKSQGFGSGASFGSHREYFEVLAGAPAESGIFEGIATDWSRISGGEPISTRIRTIVENFSAAAPWESVAALLKLREALNALETDPWIESKRVELDQLIAQCLALEIRLISAEPSIVPGSSYDVRLEVVNRSPVAISLGGIAFPGSKQAFSEGPSELPENELQAFAFRSVLPEETPYSHPYWLREPPQSPGLYTVHDQHLAGLADNPPAVVALVSVKVGETTLTYSVPAITRRVDPVHGELHTPIVVTPPAFVNMPSEVFLFGGEDRTKRVRLEVGAVVDNFAGSVRLEVPEGWSASPESVDLVFTRAEERQSVTFEITAPGMPGEGEVTAVLESGQASYRLGRRRIDYPHIPAQTLFPAAKARVVRLDLQRRGDHIGYIPGAGDRVAQSLRAVGYSVDLLDAHNISSAELDTYDAVVLGIRAYNTIETTSHFQPALDAYVKGGGTLIAQYNTSQGLTNARLAPFSIDLSRQRVTDETAPVEMLVPDHPVLNVPNRITADDFEGWVQERGLYFPEAWDSAFIPLLATHDPGEDPLAGGLLVASHGKGYLVYTSYSWFRQLPAGVPGAYRLFVNLLSLGTNE